MKEAQRRSFQAFAYICFISLSDRINPAFRVWFENCNLFFNHKVQQLIHSTYIFVAKLSSLSALFQT